jgi:hypothetical protein
VPSILMGVGRTPVASAAARLHAETLSYRPAWRHGNENRSEALPAIHLEDCGGRLLTSLQSSSAFDPAQRPFSEKSIATYNFQVRTWAPNRCDVRFWR